MDNYVKLYKNHGSSIGYWEGWTEELACNVEPYADEFTDCKGSRAKVVLQYARTMDGKVTRKEYWTKPKSVGRSNETTSKEQAGLELSSRSKKQMDKGYVEREEDAAAPSRNTLGLTKPMLAQPFDKVKPEQIDWENAYAQPKLDGHRMMYCDGVIYSRQGKEIDLPHILQAIKDAGISHMHLDGEVYLHGKTLQEIGSLVKRPREESKELELYVYDVVSDSTWYERFVDVVDNYTTTYGVQPLKAVKVECADELMALHESNLAEGFEGTMLRWGSEGYQDGKRSKHLLKIKEFSDGEYEIVGVEAGKSYFKDGQEYRVPVWVMDAGNEEELRATAQGNMYEKDELWSTREQHIGKQLTVKYHGKSKDGIPQLPVAMRFREDI